MTKGTDPMDEKSHLKEPPKRRRGEDALPYPMSRVRYDDRPRGMVRYAQGNSRKDK